MQSLTKKRKERTEKTEMINKLVLMEAACASIALGDIGRNRKKKEGGRKKKVDTATNN